MHLLIIFNSFRVGGRETYVASYLEALKIRGISGALLSSSIAVDSPGLEHFESVHECSGTDDVFEWTRWIDATGKAISQKRPDVLWAQHYDLLAAWLVSRLYRIPLLATFHGPLVGVNRPNNPMQALGMTLCLFRGDGIAAVSAEVVASLERLGVRSDNVFLVPNAIRIQRGSGGSVCRAPRSFLLITRPEKLGHMRAATRLFALFGSADRHAKLTIAAGAIPEEELPMRRSRWSDSIETSRILGARWCWEQGASFLRVLPRIRMHGYTSSPRVLIAGADVVLGMGRVVLEGLSEGKPCVLVGYDHVCGFVSSSTFARYRYANFSGRNHEERALAKVHDEIKRELASGGVPTEEQLDSISIEPNSSELHDILGRLAMRSSDEDFALARAMLHGIREGRGPEALFGIAARGLSLRELESLYLLSRG